MILTLPNLQKSKGKLWWKLLLGYGSHNDLSRPFSLVPCVIPTDGSEIMRSPVEVGSEYPQNIRWVIVIYIYIRTYNICIYIYIYIHTYIHPFGGGEGHISIHYQGSCPSLIMSPFWHWGFVWILGWQVVSRKCLPQRFPSFFFQYVNLLRSWSNSSNSDFKRFFFTLGLIKTQAVVIWWRSEVSHFCRQFASLWSTEKILSPEDAKVLWSQRVLEKKMAWGWTRGGWGDWGVVPCKDSWGFIIYEAILKMISCLQVTCTCCGSIWRG